MIEILAIITTGFTTYYVGKMQHQDNKADRVDLALKMLLRETIISAYERHKAKGYISTSDLSEFQELVKIYQDGFQGNGASDKMLNEIKNLPLKCREED